MGEDRQAKKQKSGLPAFIAGFVVMLVVGWFIFPMLLYSEQEQPISFSHVKHMAQGLECDSCHYFRDDGTFSGVPLGLGGDHDGACLNCHEDPDNVQGADPREKQFLEQYVRAGKEDVDWLVYAKQPPCVYFPHSIHTVKLAALEKAKAAKEAGEQAEKDGKDPKKAAEAAKAAFDGKPGAVCIRCHGPKAEEDVTPPYYQNRISTYSRDIWGRNISGIQSHPWSSMKMSDCGECHEQKTLLQRLSNLSQVGRGAK